MPDGNRPFLEMPTERPLATGVTAPSGYIYVFSGFTSEGVLARALLYQEHSGMICGPLELSKPFVSAALLLRLFAR